MLPDDHGCLNEDDNECDEFIHQRVAPRSFYGWYFQRCRAKLGATARSWRMPAYRPKPRQCSMSPRQGDRKPDLQMCSGESSAVYHNGKLKRQVAMEENQRPSELTAAV